MSTIVPINDAGLLHEHVYLPGTSYATYEALINEVGDRRKLRFTYDHGELEIRSPSQDHERAKKTVRADDRGAYRGAEHFSDELRLDDIPR